MVIEQAIEEYVLWKKSHTTTAYYTYKVRLDDFQDYFGKNRELASISGNDIVQYHNQMTSKGFSLTTVAYSARILKNFFDFWRGRGRATINPKEIIPIKFVAKRREVVTKEDLIKMCDVLSEDCFRDLTQKLALRLLFDTGVRVSELCDLKLGDINTPNEYGLRTAYIRRRKKRDYNLITWGKETDELLIRYLGIRLCKYPNTDFVFVSPKLKNTKLSTRTIQRWFKEIKDLALIDKDITPHSSRHGIAHEIINQGGTVRHVANKLGHATELSAYTYLRFNEAEILREQYQFLS